MSMEFSRRSFMKLSALTAVAVAGAGLLNGCSLTNPNRPVGYVGDTLEIMGKHTLTNPALSGSTLNCDMVIRCTSVSALSVMANHFMLIVTDAEGNKKEYNNFGSTMPVSISNGTFTLNKKEDMETTVTITGVEISDTDTVMLRYYPRLTSYTGEDTYNDVYATWILQNPDKDIYGIKGVDSHPETSEAPVNS